MGIRGFKDKGRPGPARLVFILTIMVFTFAFFGCEKGEDASPRAEEQAPPDQVAALTGAAVGAMAVPFELKTFDGEVVKLEELRGGPVVVNFWASWCGPCRLEAPVLREAYYAFMGTGVTFVGVAVQDREEDSKAFIEEYAWTFPVGPDPTEKIMQAYRVFGIPKTFIIDKNGRISFIVTGAVSEELLTREIEKVL